MIVSVWKFTMNILQVPTTPTVKNYYEICIPKPSHMKQIIKFHNQNRKKKICDVR